MGEWKSLVKFDQFLAGFFHFWTFLHIIIAHIIFDCFGHLNTSLCSSLVFVFLSLLPLIAHTSHVDADDGY